MLFLLCITVLVQVIYSLVYGDPHIRYQKKINRQYNRRNDYNYNDWEETTQYYVVLVTTANRTTESTTSSILSSTLPSTAEVTSPLTTTPLSSTQTSLSSSSTSTTLVTTTAEVTSPLTTTPLSSTQTSLSSSSISSTLVTNTTLNSTTVLTTTVKIRPTTRRVIDSNMIAEIKKIKQERREGHFTASLILLLHVAMAKDLGKLTLLFRGLNEEVLKTETSQQFMVFGPEVVDMVTTTSMMAASANLQQIRAQLEYILKCLYNRRRCVYREVNAIIDVADNIYNYYDLINVANVIRTVMNFPKYYKEPADIGREILDAFVFIPYQRVRGTTKEKLFLIEVDNAVEKLLKSQRPIRRHFGEIPAPEPATTEPTKLVIDLITGSNYVTNKKLMKRVKQRMLKYDHNRRKVKKMHLSRRIMTTTVLTTTTKKVNIRKSKYYIRNYIKKNVRRRTTTIKKNTMIRDNMFKYDRKIKKEELVSAEKGRRYMKKQLRNYKESDDDYYSDDDNVYDGDVSSETKQIQTFATGRHKNALTNTLSYKFGRRNAKSPDFEDEEFKLKLNLRDAMFHSEHTNIGNKRVLMEHLKEKSESFSDDELVLKKNIYKAFGYKDKFNLT